MEVKNSGKHSSLSQYGNNYSRKKFYFAAPCFPKRPKSKFASFLVTAHGV
jgi:hypothetical protein